jgi:hypothetical protein
MTDGGKFGGTQLAELTVGKTQSPAASQYFICEKHAIINTIVIFIVDQANKLFAFRT